MSPIRGFYRVKLSKKGKNRFWILHVGEQAFGFHHIFISYEWKTADSINSSHTNDVLRDIHTVRDPGVRVNLFKPGADKRLVEPGLKRS